MSDQTSNNGALVSCRQMATADFLALAYKDPCTIYFVNQTGAFTGQSMEEEGDIYLGEKLLTAQPDLTGVMRVDGTALVLNDFTDDEFVEEFELANALTSAIILDFNLHATLRNDSALGVNVECWLETGHYEEEKYVTDNVVASGQAYLAPTRNSVPTFAMVSMAGTLGGPIQSKFVRVCFSATSQVTVKRYTSTGKDQASQVRIRVFKPLAS